MIVDKKLLSIAFPTTEGQKFNYEVINRELKRRPIYECLCDERLKGNLHDSPSLLFIIGNTIDNSVLSTINNNRLSVIDS